MKALASLFLALSLLPLAAPAATRHRPVQGPVSQSTDVSGIVTDAASGRALPNAIVTVGGFNATTGADGRFSIVGARSGAQLVITVKRAGYDSRTLTIGTAQASNVSIALTAKPAATLSTVNGETYSVDPDTLEFGYSVAFVGYTKRPSLAICPKSGGDAVTISRAQIKTIPGPATKTTASCCSNVNEPQGVRLELRDGSVVEGAIKESCIGYTYDVLATDVVSGQTLFIRMSELRSLTFP